MNCWILLVLLFCNGNFRRTNSGNCVSSDYGNNTNRRGDGNCGCTDRREAERDCDCQERSDNERGNDCGCRGDVRPEPRFEARPFISYSGNTCGCEEARNSNDCNCCQ